MVGSFKTRKLVVVGSKKMIVYDDISEDKIIIYDKGIDKFSKLGENMDFDSPSSLTFKYRSGDIWIPKIDYREPLKTEAEHFWNVSILVKKLFQGQLTHYKLLKFWKKPLQSE